MTRSHALSAALALTWAALCCGCAPYPQIDPAVAERDRAIEQAGKLRTEVEALRGRLARSEKQVADLQALGADRLSKLNRVQRIRLGSHTGGIDLDGRAGDDAVRVFIEPIDQHGSVIKAAGSVTVRILDAAAERDRILLAEHRFDADRTAKGWSSGLLSLHYRFTCPWGPAPPRRDKLTVHVAFLDYLTGKTFEAQTACKIALPNSPATQPTQPTTAPAP
jgi:hypothetical protein